MDSASDIETLRAALAAERERAVRIEAIAAAALARNPLLDHATSWDDLDS